MLTKHLTIQSTKTMEPSYMTPVIVVQGGQWGSESKGLVVGRLCIDKKAKYCVRTGSINAGHTVYYNGEKYVSQLVPVGWVNPDTKLVIGAGAYVDPEILDQEVAMINEAMPDRDVRNRLFIDQRCGIQLPEHMAVEQSAKLHEKMGSTGHGVMAAIVDKMGRRQDYKLYAETEHAKGYNIADTVKMLNEAYNNKEQIVIEGTQGALLDFHLSDYPFCTVRQTNAANWIAECGLSPVVDVRVHMVIRTFPIRVAGNSGPMGEEISWPVLAREVNFDRSKYGMEPIVNPDLVDDYANIETQILMDNGFYTHPTQWSKQERWDNAEFLSNLPGQVLSKFKDHEVTELKKFFEITTVTKKLRRIARLDHDLLDYAQMLNRPNYLCVNFLNYKFPTCYNCRTEGELMNCPQWPEIKQYLEDMSKRHKICIEYVNCAPDCIIKLTHPYGLQFI